MPGLIGKKIGMTSIFDKDGKNIPCTVIQAGPCTVTQVKTVESDGYASVQLAFDEKKEKNTPKAEQGHFAKANATPKKKVIACFNGHSHNDYAENVNDIWYITINSMSYKWLGEDFENIRYSEEVDKNFKWIKYTAPYKEPLFTIVEISSEGYIKIEGKKTEWEGPSPWELDYPSFTKKYVRPEISERILRFEL